MADLEVRAESDLGRVLREFEAKGRAVDRHLPVIAEMLVGAVHDVFEAEGPGWPDLSEARKAQRRGTSYVILQDSGILAGSIAPQHGIGADGPYAEAVDGTTYGIYHTSKEPREVIPLRDFFNLGPFEQPLLEDVAALILGTF